MTKPSKPAVILLSGGLDSATCVAIAKSQGFAPYTISFRYGQRHSIELDRAKQVADYFDVVQHVVIDIDLGKLGGSALTDTNLEVPKHDSADQLGDEIPLTYVPARNTVFLAYALAWAEVLECNDLFIGVNSLDYSGYPDCRPEFISAFETMANLATRRGVEGKKLTIHSPLMNWTKSEIIRRGIELGVDYSLTISCYDPLEGGRACGRCDSCLLRSKGFQENHIQDPAATR